MGVLGEHFCRCQLLLGRAWGVFLVCHWRGLRRREAGLGEASEPFQGNHSYNREVGHLHHYHCNQNMDSLITGGIPLGAEKAGFVMASTHFPLSSAVCPREW